MSVARALGVGDDDIGRLIADHWPTWAEQAPHLHVVDDPTHLRDWLRHAPHSTVDAVLHSLARLASATGADDRDAALLLCWIMLPAACLIARDLRSIPDVDQLVAAQLWIEARSFTWQTTTQVAANLRFRVRKTLLRTEIALAARRTWADSSPAETARLDGRPVSLHAVPAEEELQHVLEWGCLHGVISDDDRMLIETVVEAAIQARPATTSGALLLGEKVSETVGRLWGVSGRTVRRRTRRALQALADLASREEHPDVA